MGLMKKMVEDISVSLGLEGEITPDVKCVAERVLAAHKETDAQRKAMETASIAKLMRELRQEVAFEQGKLSKVVCAWCEQAGNDGYMGYKPGTGEITHSCCAEHFKQVMEE